MKKRFKGIQFWYWDDGRRSELVLFDWKFGWESQQSGEFLFLGLFYLAWAYC